MAEPEQVQRVVLNVPNISCMHCVKTITRELSRLPDVMSVDASAERREVAVEYRGDSLDQIKATLSEIGYPAAQ